MEMSLIQMFQTSGCLQVASANKFLYASGLKGPIYCDNRSLLGNPILRTETLNQLISLLRKSEIEFESIMAMATGAIAMGSLLADKLELPLGYVRAQSKGHGKQSLIEGDVDKNTKVLIFEDLINQGSSIKKGIDALNSAGYEIVGVLSIVNYEFDVVKNYFSQEGIPLYSLIKFSEIVSLFESSPETKDALLRWHAQLNT